MKYLSLLKNVLVSALLLACCGTGKATTYQYTGTDCIPRSNVEILTGEAWTDGEAIYRYQQIQQPSDAGSVHTDSAKYKCFTFNGVTPSEDDYDRYLYLEELSNGRWRSVDLNDGRYYRCVDCNLSFDNTSGVLIFRDSCTGEIIDVLVALPEKYNTDDAKAFKKYVETDMTTFFLEGEYTTREGKTVAFDPETFRATGTLFNSKSFNLGSVSNRPVPVLIIDNQAYYIEKIHQGLNLIPLQNFDGESYNYIKGGDSIELMRTDDDFWPLLTQRVLTKAEILYYAGYSSEGPYSDEEIARIKAAYYYILAMMAQSIYARHGYTFKDNKEAQLWFMSVSWYNPQTDEVQLTEAEEINIQLIRALHNRQFD